MAQISTFKDLLVWQRSHDIVKKIYEITRTFPSEERYILASQMKRAAISFASNIVEGFRRRTTKDSLSFYNIAQGSLEELRYQLFLSFDLKFISDSKYNEINVGLEETSKLLNGWVKSNRQRLN